MQKKLFGNEVEQLCVCVCFGERANVMIYQTIVCGEAVKPTKQ